MQSDARALPDSQPARLVRLCRNGFSGHSETSTTANEEPCSTLVHDIISFCLMSAFYANIRVMIGRSASGFSWQGGQVVTVWERRWRNTQVAAPCGGPCNDRLLKHAWWHFKPEQNQGPTSAQQPLRAQRHDSFERLIDHWGPRLSLPYLWCAGRRLRRRLKPTARPPTASALSGGATNAAHATRVAQHSLYCITLQIVDPRVIAARMMPMETATARPPFPNMRRQRHPRLSPSCSRGRHQEWLHLSFLLPKISIMYRSASHHECPPDAIGARVANTATS